MYVDDVVAWLRGHEWLVQNGYHPRYHAVLCDPPYFLGSIVKRFGKPDSAPAQYGTDGAFQRASRGFMGQTWDGFESPWHYQEWVTEWATLLLSFVYPGAVLLAFGGTRTFHRLAAGLEDAGWIIADTIAWITGQGFPKSHNGRNWDAGEHWHGYGTALKPAWEGVVVARAPWRGTYAALAREFGTGAINVDGGRIQFANNEPYSIDERCRPNTRGTKRKPSVVDYVHEIAAVNVSHFGRWPANLILGCACESAEHDADCPVRLLGEQSGERDGGGAIVDPPSTSALFGGHGRPSRPAMADSGTAARFFFKAKAAAWEREAGLTTRSHHPTMKPIALTEYLARLLLPPPLQEPRRLLIPFAGSGSEMIGARLAGWDVIDGIEQSAEYADIARARLAWWSQFSSYEQARSAAGADKREAAERDEARALGVEQLALFDSGGETCYTGGD
ncbi:MAG: hypothetical protein BroJett042_31570 [Bacteroidota bacterium]|nr:MAG: hypothetical protein BroJett042_31570 [Bacteroidota bacterium]